MHRSRSGCNCTRTTDSRDRLLILRLQVDHVRDQRWDWLCHCRVVDCRGEKFHVFPLQPPLRLSRLLFGHQNLPGRYSREAGNFGRDMKLAILILLLRESPLLASHHRFLNPVYVQIGERKIERLRRHSEVLRETLGPVVLSLASNAPLAALLTCVAGVCMHVLYVRHQLCQVSERYRLHLLLLFFFIKSGLSCFLQHLDLTSLGGTWSLRRIVVVNDRALVWESQR